MKNLLLSSLLGGLAAFVWYSLSWTVLHLHPTLKFKDEAAVAAVLKENAGAEAGVYVLPGEPGGDSVAMEAHLKRMEEGPVAFATVRGGSREVSMGANMFKSFLCQCACAFLLTSLLLCARPLGYGARVWFVIQAALLGGMLCHLPPMIWWETPVSVVLREFLDLAVAWGLAGLVIAKFTALPPGSAA